MRKILVRFLPATLAGATALAVLAVPALSQEEPPADPADPTAPTATTDTTDTAAAPNPGTIKVDGEDFDDIPNNDPHVGCSFRIDFYGFPQGDLYATVIFAAQPPTGSDVLLTDTVFVGEDPAGGGTDLDAQRTYDLSPYLAGLTPSPTQGYHIKLTVNIGTQAEADAAAASPLQYSEAAEAPNNKHKVFWVENCTPTTTSSSSTTSSSTTSSSTTSSSTTSSSTTSSSTTSSSTTSSSTTSSSTTSTSSTTTTVPPTTAPPTTAPTTTTIPAPPPVPPKPADRAPGVAPPARAVRAHPTTAG